MHLRMPSIDQGVQAFLWAVFFFLLLWVGMLALGRLEATALILSLLAGGAIFLFVRLRGEDRPAGREPTRAPRRGAGPARGRAAPRGARAVGRPRSSLSSAEQCASRSSEAAGFTAIDGGGVHHDPR